MKLQATTLATLVSGVLATRGILYEPTVAKVLDHMPDCGWSCWPKGVAATPCAAENNITCICDSVGKMASGMEGCAEDRCDKANWCTYMALHPTPLRDSSLMGQSGSTLGADVSITLGVMCYRLWQLPPNSTQTAEAAAAICTHLAQQHT
ncbi:hypothetical protein O9K51_02371 [Purpureocillium lavendulum]|uniref:CFEM domain-containing protein n=1 Tax=Purpureocillium lavendulum TaxID=1247861 RepID=A0AB34FXY3_9HYPO|nr:hypothetical protein O9K51_02371 [Purpureocillium lavendulum]